MLKNVKPSMEICGENVNYTCPQNDKVIIFMPMLVGDRWSMFSKSAILLTSELV